MVYQICIKQVYRNRKSSAILSIPLLVHFIRLWVYLIKGFWILDRVYSKLEWWYTCFVVFLMSSAYTFVRPFSILLSIPNGIGSSNYWVYHCVYFLVYRPVYWLVYQRVYFHVYLRGNIKKLIEQISTDFNLKENSFFWLQLN